MRHQIQLFADRSGEGINWRLLAANNRETARGVRLHGTDAECRAAIRHLQAAAAELTPRTRRVEQARWTWELLLDDVVVATSPNRFDRLVRCGQVLAAVTATVGTAAIAPNLIDMTGRRRAPLRLVQAPLEFA